jgi:anti-anti-sigma factor
LNEINERLAGKVLVLEPKGNLDIMTYQKLKQRLAAAVDKDKVKYLVIDMSGVDYVASSGWAVLISQGRRIRRGNGNLVICGLKPEIRNIYETMSIETVLPSCESSNEAIEKVQQNG